MALWSSFLLVVLGVGAVWAQNTTEILQDFYAATQGENWKNNTNWLLGDPCVNGWYGITCDDNDVITGIDLTWNNLAGSLPASLNGLTSLQLLSLGYNNFLGGELPDLSGLVSLQELYLNNSLVNGTFPDWIPQLQDLNSISLVNCSRLRGEFPVSWCALTKLRYLSLGGQELSGSLPDCIGNWTDLIYLEIFSTKINGPLPDSLTTLRKLQFVELNYNQFSGTIPENIGNLAALQRFTAYDNDLTGTLPESLGQLKNLYEIHLRNNSLYGPIPHALQGMSKIAVIGLESNYINGTIPEWLSPDVMFVLQNLDLRCNNLVGPLPAWLQTDPGVYHVMTVWFGCNNITDEDLQVGDSWCLKALRCGPNACDGSRCMLPPQEEANRIVVIVLVGFLILLGVGNATLVGVLIKKKCSKRRTDEPEMRDLLRNED